MDDDLEAERGRHVGRSMRSGAWVPLVLVLVFWGFAGYSLYQSTTSVDGTAVITSPPQCRTGFDADGNREVECSAPVRTAGGETARVRVPESARTGDDVEVLLDPDTKAVKGAGTVFRARLVAMIVGSLGVLVAAFAVWMWRHGSGPRRERGVREAA